MTSTTELVGLRTDFRSVSFVAVAAGDAVRVHPALEKRSVFVHFVADLTICEVEILVEEGGPVARDQRPLDPIVVAELRSA
jgi:hypothetical protein